jgi:hypothetical protein
MPNDSDNNLKSSDFTDQRNQAVSSAVTALVLINGGAAVALLAFVQAMWDKNSGPMYAVVAGMLLYSLGVLFAALITLFRYQASLHFQGKMKPSTIVIISVFMLHGLAPWLPSYSGPWSLAPEFLLHYASVRYELGKPTHDGPVSAGQPDAR